MRYGICSYSLRRTFERGDMDIFSYITWCKEAGFTQLDDEPAFALASAAVWWAQSAVGFPAPKA